MNCVAKYIQDLEDLTGEQKNKLQDIHEGVFEEIHDSKLFRLEEGSLFLSKYDIKKINAQKAFLTELNAKYGTEVARERKDDKFRQVVKINVVNLRHLVMPGAENISKQTELSLNKLLPKPIVRNPDEVNYTLGAVTSLLSGKVRNYDSKKPEGFYNDLQKQGVTKEQIELVKDVLKGYDNLSSKEAAVLLENAYKFKVEVKTAKEKETRYFGREFPENYDNLSEKEKEKAIEEIDRKKELIPTQYYSNLTVPGGTNYTENEISTPDITPSIKGHAQFSTDKGIGWFRSDDKAIGGEYKKGRELTSDDFDDEGNINSSIAERILTKDISEVKKGSPTKDRRILELQSDLFQKIRNNFQIGQDHYRREDATRFTNNQDKFYKNSHEISKKEYNESFEKGNVKLVDSEGRDYDLERARIFKEYFPGKTQVPLKDLEKATEDYRKKRFEKNTFLQLLLRDSNWVNFFIKSIVQDSAKKGYENVLFPTGDTASKVEGHDTLEEFKKQKEDRIEYLSQPRWAVYNKNGAHLHEYHTKEEAENYSEGKYDIVKKDGAETNKKEIEQLKQELQRVEAEGFAALKPIYNFYENTVGNILKKIYGDKIERIKDEYGNEWWKLPISGEHEEPIVIGSGRISQEELDALRNIENTGEMKQEDIDIYRKSLGISDKEVKDKLDNCL